ncbi:hypothetical protein [Streptomyces jumonjinensis]|uniref:hypothetical protein n=1 Tax=Streptomyces jumonjinensis TaxID=1945 RepID=UPI0037B1F4A5
MYVLLEKQGGLRTFHARFPQFAARAAQELGLPHLKKVNPSRLTVKRWLDGDQVPRDDAAAVLEHAFQMGVAALFQPVAPRAFVVAPTHHEASSAAVSRLDARFDSSYLSPAAAPGSGGVWLLDGIRLLDGTSVPVQIYEGPVREDALVIGPEHLDHVRAFTGPARRAMLLGSSCADGGEGLYGLDSAVARRQLAAVAMPFVSLPVPVAYLLDDLTYALVWVMANLDDSLLADDLLLAAEVRTLDCHLSQRRSAIARSAVPDLSAVGSLWLGSLACERYIERGLAQMTDTGSAPVYWAGAQTGEQAAGWLFFTGRHRLLRLLRSRAAGTGEVAQAVFCIPRTAVKGSEPYERVLLLLTVALMEMHDLTVWVCTGPEYGEVGEFVLAGDRAMAAHWVPRTPQDRVWHVDTAAGRSGVLPYAQVLDHARAHALNAGAGCGMRIRALAQYLDLDWSWLVRRCRELGECGVSGLLVPRSRHLDAGEVTRVLRFVAALAPV